MVAVTARVPDQWSVRERQAVIFSQITHIIGFTPTNLLTNNKPDVDSYAAAAAAICLLYTSDAADE